MKQRLQSAKRIVVKIGSARLVDAKTGEVISAWLSTLIDYLAKAKAGGADFIVVSSGAIALGRRSLGLPNGKLRLEESQAAAAVGQIALAQAWSEAFRTKKIVARRWLPGKDSNLD